MDVNDCNNYISLKFYNITYLDIQNNLVTSLNRLFSLISLNITHNDVQKSHIESFYKFCFNMRTIISSIKPLKGQSLYIQGCADSGKSVLFEKYFIDFYGIDPHPSKTSL